MAVERIADESYLRRRWVEITNKFLGLRQGERAVVYLQLHYTDTQTPIPTQRNSIHTNTHIHTHTRAHTHTHMHEQRHRDRDREGRV